MGKNVIKGIPYLYPLAAWLPECDSNKLVNIFIALLLWHIHSSINLALHRVCGLPMSYKQCYIQRAVHIILKCNAVAMTHGEHKLSGVPDLHNIKDYSHMQSQEVSFPNVI